MNKQEKIKARREKNPVSSEWKRQSRSEKRRERQDGWWYLKRNKGDEPMTKAEINAAFNNKRYSKEGNQNDDN